MLCAGTALVALVAAYAVLGLAVSLVTLLRYAQEKGEIDALAVILTLREILGEAISFIWLLLLFHSWGLLNLTVLGWRATPPPPVTEAPGQLLALALALLLALYYAFYLNGRLWPALLASLLGTLALQLAFGFQLLDIYFLAAFLLIGLAATLASALALFSELRTSL